MSASGVVNGIKTEILSNEVSLTDGLQTRSEIHQVTTSSLTAPTGYYFIHVSVTTDEYDGGDARNSSTGLETVERELVIEVADEALADSREDEIFELSESDFRTFVERIVDLLRELGNTGGWVDYTETQTFSPDYDNTTRFRLVRSNQQNRRVRVNHLSGTWEDSETYGALFYAQILLRVEECNA